MNDAAPARDRDTGALPGSAADPTTAKHAGTPYSSMELSSSSVLVNSGWPQSLGPPRGAIDRHPIACRSPRRTARCPASFTGSLSSPQQVAARRAAGRRSAEPRRGTRRPESDDGPAATCRPSRRRRTSITSRDVRSGRPADGSDTGCRSPCTRAETDSDGLTDREGDAVRPAGA